MPLSPRAGDWGLPRPLAPSKGTAFPPNRHLSRYGYLALPNLISSGKAQPPPEKSKRGHLHHPPSLLCRVLRVSQSRSLVRFGRRIVKTVVAGRPRPVLQKRAANTSRCKHGGNRTPLPSARDATPAREGKISTGQEPAHTSVAGGARADKLHAPTARMRRAPCSDGTLPWHKPW
jgi:hypothetical protein